VRFRLERVSRRPPWPLWAIGLVSGWLLLVEAWAIFGPDDTSLCHFKRATGAACPTCGLTRGVTAVAHGDVLGGLAYNPLWMTVLAGFGGALLLRTVAGRAVRVDWSRRVQGVVLAVALVLLVANWAYVIRYVR